jgi:two-component system response regulator HydG
VVDDQPMMRTTTALVLRTEGYIVSEAATGQEALDFLTSNNVDVLLTDLKMEPMDGLSLLKKALEAVPRLQVIVMTAFGSIDSAVEAMRLGAYDYIIKPFKDGGLRRSVELALERSRLLAQVALFTDEFNPSHNPNAPVGTSSPKRGKRKRAGSQKQRRGKS